MTVKAEAGSLLPDQPAHIARMGVVTCRALSFTEGEMNLRAKEFLLHFCVTLVTEVGDVLL